VVGKRKSTKYSNTRVEYDGHKFDSKRECARYKELKLLEKAGSISLLCLQPKFWLKCGGKDILIKSDRYPNGRRASYRADFEFIDDLGVRHVEDVKGFDTSGSRLRRAIVEAEYGVRVEIVR
jgi:hypothetical protein